MEDVIDRTRAMMWPQERTLHCEGRRAKNRGALTGQTGNDRQVDAFIRCRSAAPAMSASMGKRSPGEDSQVNEPTAAG